MSFVWILLFIAAVGYSLGLPLVAALYKETEAEREMRLMREAEVARRRLQAAEEKLRYDS